MRASTIQGSELKRPGFFSDRTRLSNAHVLVTGVVRRPRKENRASDCSLGTISAFRSQQTGNSGCVRPHARRASDDAGSPDSKQSQAVTGPRETK
jgi:hypothetical protein